MWYHYVIALLVLYFVIKAAYNQLTAKYPSFVSRLPEIVGLVVSYYVLTWCYNGIYPPSMFGGRRY